MVMQEGSWLCTIGRCVVCVCVGYHSIDLRVTVSMVRVTVWLGLQAGIRLGWVIIHPCRSFTEAQQCLQGKLMQLQQVSTPVDPVDTSTREPNH